MSGGGCCALGKGGGKPSLGYCRHCLQQAPVPRQRGGCGITRWLGIRWYGKPKPIRVWEFIVQPDHPPYRGGSCGCIVKLKQGLMILKQAWRAWRMA